MRYATHAASIHSWLENRWCGARAPIGACAASVGDELLATDPPFSATRSAAPQLAQVRHNSTLPIRDYLPKLIIPIETIETEQDQKNNTGKRRAMLHLRPQFDLRKKSNAGWLYRKERNENILIILSYFIDLIID
jgi:hypothetical protein